MASVCKGNPGPKLCCTWGLARSSSGASILLLHRPYQTLQLPRSKSIAHALVKYIDSTRVPHLGRSDIRSAVNTGIAGTA